jgi:hypothetical protein
MLLALPTNTRLGWKGFSGTLAYYEHYGRKIFIALAPGSLKKHVIFVPMSVTKKKKVLWH